MGLYKVISRNIILKLQHYNKLKSVGLNYFKIKYLKHKTSPAIEKYDVFGLDIQYINGPDFLHSLMELFVDEIYKSDMPTNAYIIDCGANIGLSTIYFHKCLPDAEIVSFEPDDANYSLLSANVAQLKSNKIKILKEAVWIHDDFISFENTGGLGSKIGEENGSNTVKIKATSLKNFITKKVDLLKVDIEGAEYEVIKDIKDKLHLVDRFFIEYHGSFSNQNELLEILNIVHTSGFAFYIKEALDIFPHPFSRGKNPNPYEIQLNIFCFKKP
jgi:FkbM family methyltransferase